MKKHFQLSAAALLVSAVSSSAATIAGYDFSSDLTATYTGANVLAGVVDLNNLNTSMNYEEERGDNTGSTEGITFSTTAGSLIAGNANLKTGNRNAAIADNDYFSFTIAPESGFTLHLDKIVFSGARAFDVARSAESFALMSSIGGFTSTDLSLLEGAITAVDSAVGAYDQFSIDLSGEAAYQNITTSTEFRIYMWGGTGGGSQAAIQYDNLGVTGEVVAIPEPSSTALLGLGGLALILRRRQ